MSLSNIFLLLLHLALVILMVWMGWQDWQTREVSNALSIPLAMFGLIGLIFRLSVREPSASISLMVVVVLTAAALRNWMGGADWKALVGLLGLWPLAGFAAILGAGLFGAGAVLWTRNRNITFPAVCVFAIACVLTLAGEVSIMSLIKA